MKLSLIVPVYNRPQEVQELLESLHSQRERPHEILVVEDGSQVPCQAQVQAFSDKLPLRYLSKPNGGPGPARNFGAQHASGDWVVFLDSDVILPSGYLESVRKAIEGQEIDAFGGPDGAHESFTSLQRAIGFAMTSFLTTGGIRGATKLLERYNPRSFNMGIRKALFDQLGGFSQLRFGEDIDLSLRLHATGAKVGYLPKALVYHKRRTRLAQFYKQIFNSGAARITLGQRHPGSLKLVHLLPALFVVGSLVAIPLFAFLWPWGLLGFPLLALLFFLDALRSTGEFVVALKAIPACFTQLFGYGLGFLSATFKRLLGGKREEYKAFEKTFYD